MAALLDEFIGITEGLNKQGIRYAVCGGWAMAIHGFLRATLDIDILILADDLDAVREVAVGLGFDIEGSPLTFDGGRTEIRRISKLDSDTKELITLDMILVTAFMEDVWNSRQKVVWKNGEYSIVSRDGMRKMKEAAGRPKDLIDLEFLRGDEDAG